MHILQAIRSCAGGDKEKIHPVGFCQRRWTTESLYKKDTFVHLRTHSICGRLVLLQIAGRGACAEMYYIDTQLSGGNYSKVSWRCLLIVSRPQKQIGAKNSFA